ncbi:hypothetical protein AAFF_G00059920 [Aldrovandia affinis]|uniref:Uncharacterized protein n=1 Tax=Aldrovandia affinis TaxID=143900 RepID=A0AAD7S030_9TELE|nr:hypothetical protein AAFF_G00059920 [Aldrovandia affinis]
MENVNGKRDIEGKFPPGSFLNKISTIFTRAGTEKLEPHTQAKEKAVLTAFRTFPNKESCNGESKGNNDPVSEEGDLRTGGCGRGDDKDPGTSDTEESGASTEGAVDAELVQVCLVDTYSDTETEDETEDKEGSLVQSEQVISAPKEDGGKVGPSSDQCVGQIETETQAGTVDQNAETRILKLHIYLGKTSESTSTQTGGAVSVLDKEGPQVPRGSEGLSGVCSAEVNAAAEGCELPASARPASPCPQTPAVHTLPSPLPCQLDPPAHLSLRPAPL